MGGLLPWVWVYLLEFNLMRRDRFPFAIEYQKSGTGGTLIDRTNKAFCWIHDLPVPEYGMVAVFSTGNKLIHAGGSLE